MLNRDRRRKTKLSLKQNQAISFFIKVPTSTERRASANEALLGLNGYANMLAACSSMGISPQQANTAGGSSGKTRKSIVNYNPGSPQQQQPNQSMASVEEEGANYLNRHGAHKRNTVHALASPLSMLTASQQRYARTPYAKQSPTGAANNERRSSWASSSNAAHLNPQQFSKLESIYSQSIRSGANGADAQRHSLGANEHLNSIQQLQIEFQKLQACTERPSLTNW